MDSAKNINFWFPRLCVEITQIWEIMYYSGFFRSGKTRVSSLVELKIPQSDLRYWTLQISVLGGLAL